MNEEQKKAEVINFKELKRRMKVQEMKLKAKELGKKALKAGANVINYVEEHKEGVLIVAGATAGAAKIVRAGVKAHENKRKNETIYDHSSNQRLTLRRPLKQKEKLEAFERNQRGEKYVDIYRSMGVL